jgi:hypothetical protein
MSTAAYTGLADLVLVLAKGNAALADQALRALTDAADRYHAPAPAIDAEGHRTGKSVSASRNAVRRVGERLRGLQDALAAMPFDAMATVLMALGRPLGAVNGILRDLATAVDTARSELDHQPNKPPDYRLTVWAYEVALVLRDILGVRPTATRVSSPLVTGARGGAAYGRLLAAALPLVVAQHVDVDRLIGAGLKLLKNPTGDQYPPHV